MSQIIHGIDHIVQELSLGHVVALPTETVYGLAADANNEQAIRKIFEIKQRPLNHPLIMHVAPSWDLEQWIEKPPEYVIDIIKSFWPGPLTMVFKLKKQAKISPLITGNQNTIAIRCPAHPLALDVLNKLGRPIVAPSANPFGKISPTEAWHVMDDFPDHAFSILEGGACQTGLESTILSCIHNDHCMILRHGVISENELQPFCHLRKPIEKQDSIRVSGNLKTHYQPKKPLYYFNQAEASLFKQTNLNIKNSFVLCFSEFVTEETNHHRFQICPKTTAREFYRQLRIADRSNKERIFIELPKETPEWMALIDRIIRAGVSIREICNDKVR